MHRREEPSLPVSQSSSHLGKLGEGIHISHGEKTSVFKRPEVGGYSAVVIIFGWMAAPLQLLEKYAAEHRLCWPSADIVMVQAQPPFMWWTDEQRRNLMRPLADYLVRTVYSQGRSNGILLHVLSNGGGFHLIALSQVLHTLVPSQPALEPIRLAMVLDSVPGNGEYASINHFFVNSTPKPPLAKAVLTLAAAMIHSGIQIKRFASGQKPLFQTLHAGLRAPDLLPATDPHAPRVYMYSAVDSMVHAASVEDHIENLKKAVPWLDIAVEKFVDSQHVRHEKSDPVRYWQAVRGVWDRSLGTVRAKL
ncbi:hypothetical protein FB45DRAFT_1019188 [Roridomyces roridus]|uniref:Uncharacterized protein n=1 Tax=Roridomyces roridus TaxID=1738132 RepID=A0AAD7CEI1_9AGAR|nr:hypothetical protein FB45DRAFT_1019188 [Roridomyces roridus]